MDAEQSFSKANEAFVEENYDEAVEHYTKAIELDATKDEYYLGRAQAKIKLGEHAEAVADASKATELDNKNAKGYLRKGVALFHLDQYQAALDSLLTGQRIDCNDKNISTWVRKCEAELDLKKKEVDEGSDIQYGCSTVHQTQSGADKATNLEVQSKPVCQASAAQGSVASGAQTRYDWYQTETHVTVTVLVKNVKKDDLKTDIGERRLGISIKMAAATEYSLNLDLAHAVSPEQSQVKVLTSKVEVKLKKLDGIKWTKLEGEEEKIKQFHPGTDGDKGAQKYPSSSPYARDWDKVVADIGKEEKDDKLEGDAALNNLFQQIYSDGSEEVRRAMNKSFMESGGTVLSTNWKEVGDKKVEVKPPDGMEHKPYTS